MHNQSVWEQLTKLAYLNLYINVVNSSIELDVFSHTQTPVTPNQLAEKTGWHAGNTKYLLSTLTSLNFLKKEGDKFVNTDETNKYLVKGKKEYLGGFLLFYGLNEGMIPMDVKKLVTKGPDEQFDMGQEPDFSQYGEQLRMAQRGYRQEEIVNIVRNLPENSTIKHILDLGCATGMLGIAVTKDNESRTCVLYDRIPKELIMESVEQEGLKGRAEVKNGNFLTDDIGSGYDLITAVGVMLFAKGQLESIMKKCYNALNNGGILLVVGEGIKKDYTGPWDMMLGYLPYYFQGMELGIMENEIEEAAKSAGFKNIEKHTTLLCSGNQDIIVLRK